MFLSNPQFLERQGIRVLRFWNHPLFGELDSAQLEIWQARMSCTDRQAEIDAIEPWDRRQLCRRQCTTQWRG